MGEYLVPSACHRINTRSMRDKLNHTSVSNPGTSSAIHVLNILLVLFKSFKVAARTRARRAAGVSPEKAPTSCLGDQVGIASI